MECYSQKNSSGFEKLIANYIRCNALESLESLESLEKSLIFLSLVHLEGAIVPQVSVVIPAYNAMSFLPEALASVLKQTFTDFEVIIVNDGSSDDIEQWAATLTDPRVKLISQENQGSAGARNTGLANVQGEYIAFLDADDLWDMTKLEKQVCCLEQNPDVGLVYTWTALIDEKGKPYGKVLINHDEGYVWQRLLEHNIVECGSVAMIRRCCYEAVGLFDCSLPFSYGEDWDLWLRISAQYPFKVIKELLVYYRSHSNNLSKNWTAMEQSHHIVIEKAFADVSPTLMHLKSRSYAIANLSTAWKALQNLDGECEQAKYFQKQALLYHPQLRYSKEYFRLSLAITLTRLFGLGGYSKIRDFFYRVQHKSRMLRDGFSASFEKVLVLLACPTE